MIQTTILDTEVVYVDPQVSRWGIENILGAYAYAWIHMMMPFSILTMVCTGFGVVSIGGDVIEVCSPIKAGLHTPAGRQLAKLNTDAAGYMLIMQTVDAIARRRYIESRSLGRVIFSHYNSGTVPEFESPGTTTTDDINTTQTNTGVKRETEEEIESVCIQYHPRGIPGGIMPELDSHATSPENPDPLSEFSPWHTCGPMSAYPTYSSAMRRNSHLKLIGATLRLSSGDKDPSDAARQWHEMFGIPRQNDELIFTNSRLEFLPADPNKREGLESVTIQVKGRAKFDRILKKVADHGLCGDGWTNMLGIKWYFVLDEVESDLDSNTHTNGRDQAPKSKRPNDTKL